MAFKHLQTSLVEGFDSDHCVLCDASLDTVLEEVPCLHWFVTPGRRGFRIDRLAPVFEIFELDAAIAYLQICAGAEPGRAHLPVQRIWTEDGVTRVAIHWRRRQWLFEYEGGAGPAGTVRRFELTMLFEDVVMERARIELGQSERKVVVTTLAKRRLGSPASSPPQLRQ
jgi:hypothetical protein